MLRGGSCRLLLALSCVLTSLTKSQIVHEDLKKGTSEWITRRNNHSGLGLTDDELRSLSAMDDHRHFQTVLDPILVPRVPDTPGNTAVRKHIVDHMRAMEWAVEEDQFLDNTPLKRDVSFTNIVATLDPRAPRRLVLACHYDSLLTNSGKFVGATDSAVPCAQLINLAFVLDRQLKAHRDQANEVTLQFLFFDGEEAFVRWSRRDSTYGARNLAAKLELTPYTDTGARGVTHLHRIDLFVLLDLLGVANSKFFSYFPESEPWYVRMLSFERRLDNMDLTRGRPNMFQQQQRYFSGIEDDHIPFLERDVPILHLIPSPFPRGWHKDSDNKGSLDGATISNQNTLLRALVTDYLHLQL